MKNTSSAPRQRKLMDTKLNIWIKDLPLADKKQFYKSLFNNRLIWAEGMHISEKRLRFNNYRYKGTGEPTHQTKINIYLTALSIEPTLKITSLFNDIEQEYISFLLPILAEASSKTNNFSYVKNKEEQLDRNFA
jgi:hypothetical protein